MLARGDLRNILSTDGVGDVREVVNPGRTVVRFVGVDSGFDSAFRDCGTAALERRSDAKTMITRSGA